MRAWQLLGSGTLSSSVQEWWRALACLAARCGQLHRPDVGTRVLRPFPGTSLANHGQSVILMYSCYFKKPDRSNRCLDCLCMQVLADFASHGPGLWLARYSPANSRWSVCWREQVQDMSIYLGLLECADLHVEDCISSLSQRSDHAFHRLPLHVQREVAIHTLTSNCCLQSNSSLQGLPSPDTQSGPPRQKIRVGSQLPA